MVFTFLVLYLLETMQQPDSLSLKIWWFQFQRKKHECRFRLCLKLWRNYMSWIVLVPSIYFEWSCLRTPPITRNQKFGIVFNCSYRIISHKACGDAYQALGLRICSSESQGNHCFQYKNRTNIADGCVRGRFLVRGIRFKLYFCERN